MFHHTTLGTRKLDEMVEFSEKVAGLEPVYYSQGGTWMTNDEAAHRIALLALPGLKAPEDKGHTVGLHHSASEYASFDQWLDNCIRLRDEGIVPFLNLDHGTTTSMYYQYPEGNGVEIQVDGFGSWAAGKEWMWASQEFGDYFDPDRIVEARAGGLEFQEIHTRARGGEYEPRSSPSSASRRSHLPRTPPDGGRTLMTLTESDVDHTSAGTTMDVLVIETGPTGTTAALPFDSMPNLSGVRSRVAADAGAAFAAARP